MSITNWIRFRLLLIAGVQLGVAPDMLGSDSPSGRWRRAEFISTDKVILIDLAGTASILCVKTGEILWEKRLGTSVLCSLQWTEEKILASEKSIVGVFAHSGDHAFDISIGNVVIYQTIALSDGFLAITSEQTLCRLDIEGSVVWKVPVAVAPFSSVLPMGEAILVTSAHGGLLAFDQGGRELWGIKSMDWIMNGVVALPELDLLVCVDRIGTVAILDTSGRVVRTWATGLPFSSPERPLEAPNGRILFCADNGRLVVLDAERYELNIVEAGPYCVSRAVYCRGVGLLVIDSQYRLVLIDNSGRELFTYVSMSPILNVRREGESRFCRIITSDGETELIDMQVGKQ
jgi:hypothetical protein